MRFRYLIEQIYQRPWYITTDAHRAIQKTFQAAVARRGGIGVQDDDESDEDAVRRWDASGIPLSDMINTRRPMQMKDGIACIHVLGPMARGMTKFERVCGATGHEQITTEVNAAVIGGARGILMSMDTPGGTVNGTPEVAELVSETAQKIPVVVHSADTIASGGFYIAAGATRIVTTPSAVVGSIGVVVPFVDFSEQMAKDGLVGDPITNKEGDLKGAGWITGSLTDAQRAHYQREVDGMFAEFRDHVLAHRDVPSWAMRGQTMTGHDAVAANLVDEFGDEQHAMNVLRGLIG